MKITLFLLVFCSFGLVAQNKAPNEFGFNEFLGFVKKNHPLVKNANLEINKAQANLLMARGAFDPKIEGDFSQKQFKELDYYSIFNSSFKIPTWYGIELKAGFENADGVFLNPQNSLPNQGLTSIGISVPLGQGLWINQRMADLRNAKMQIRLSENERKLQAIEVLYDASVAYFNWKKSHEEMVLYQQYYDNASIRYTAIRSLIKNGDKAAIDSTEAKITIQSRLVSLEDAKLKLNKAKLEVSNFIWTENNIPLELKDEINPEKYLDQTIQETLRTNALNQDFELNNHPKINALENKIDILNIERKQKANMLLPKVNVGYSYLSEPSSFNDYKFENYKIGFEASFPIFLRKERGALKLAKFKIQETETILSLEKVSLTNKIKAQKFEISSLVVQLKTTLDLVKNYEIMVKSEERLFEAGESSLFLINSRENSLVSSKIASIALQNRFYTSNATYFKIMANPD